MTVWTSILHKVQSLVLKVEVLLQQHPIIGVISPITGAVLPFVEFLTPYLQFTGLAVGLGVGVLTFIAKWKEIFGQKDKTVK